jgi:chromate transporter
MILGNCGFMNDNGIDVTSILITFGLAIVYYGSRKIKKNGISPIGLICIAAVVGVAVYGI